MGKPHVVDREGRYDGLTLREALPLVVSQIVSAFDPMQIVLFGSVARGDDGPDSDLDLLVVFDHVDPSERRQMMRNVRASIRTFVPVDVAIADLDDLTAGLADVGSVAYWPLREGRVVHRKSDELVD